MESNPHISPTGMRANRKRTAAIAFALSLSIPVFALAAETYRWKDNNGEVHYGSAVPPEYADQPYDVLNATGLVIRHVEKTNEPIVEVKQEEAPKGRQPLIPLAERQRLTDRLLVVQFRSEEDIETARELEIAQLDYDLKLINQSYASTQKTIRSQVRLFADKQRAGLEIKPQEQNTIDKQLARMTYDLGRLATLADVETAIRARYEEKLERYRFLTGSGEDPVEEVDAGAEVEGDAGVNAGIDEDPANQG